MNFSSLSDQALLNKLESLGQAERSTLVTVLHCLDEVERRRLFSELSYTSLFDYCSKKLKYPEDQAQRRIVAMRMMRKVPELESKIETGSLTLTSIGLVQSHARREGI